MVYVMFLFAFSAIVLWVATLGVNLGKRLDKVEFDLEHEPDRAANLAKKEDALSARVDVLASLIEADRRLRAS